MRYVLLGFDCLLLDDGYTRREIDFEAVHSVTTAKLPPTRKDSTIASFSEAISWPSSTVPLLDVLSRKNLSGGQFGCPWRRAGAGNRALFACCGLLFGNAARCRSCRRCCHRIAPLPKLAACPPRSLRARRVIFRTQDCQISVGTPPSAVFRRRPFSEKRRWPIHHRFPSRVDSCKRPISFSPTIWSSLYSATRRPLGTRSVRRS